MPFQIHLKKTPSGFSPDRAVMLVNLKEALSDREKLQALFSYVRENPDMLVLLEDIAENAGLRGLFEVTAAKRGLNIADCHSIQFFSDFKKTYLDLFMTAGEVITALPEKPLLDDKTRQSAENSDESVTYQTERLLALIVIPNIDRDFVCFARKKPSKPWKFLASREGVRLPTYIFAHFKLDKRELAVDEPLIVETSKGGFDRTYLERTSASTPLSTEEVKKVLKAERIAELLHALREEVADGNPSPEAAFLMNEVAGLAAAAEAKTGETLASRLEANPLIDGTHTAKFAFPHGDGHSRKHILPEDKIQITVSMGGEKHENGKFKATVELAVKSVGPDNVYVVLDDTCQYRNYMAYNELLSEAEAKTLAQSNGDDWLKRADAVFRKYDIQDENIFRWADFSDSDQFPQKLAQVRQALGLDPDTGEEIPGKETLPDFDPHYRAAFDENVTTFLRRFLKSKEDCALAWNMGTSHADLDKRYERYRSRARDLSFAYLVEENAVMLIWAEYFGCEVELYPSKRNASMAATHTKFIRPLIGPVLEPVSLKFHLKPVVDLSLSDEVAVVVESPRSRAGTGESGGTTHSVSPQTIDLSDEELSDVIVSDFSGAGFSETDTVGCLSSDTSIDTEGRRASVATGSSSLYAGRAREAQSDERRHGSERARSAPALGRSFSSVAFTAQPGS